MRFEEARFLILPLRSMGDPRDPALVLDLIAAASKIISYTTGKSKQAFADDSQLISADSFEVAVLGEAAKRLSRDLQVTYPEIPWRQIAAVRDVPDLLGHLRRIQTGLGT